MAKRLYVQFAQLMRIKNKFLLLFVLIMILALPLVILESQKQQDIRQRAAQPEDIIYFETSIVPSYSASANQEIILSIDLVNTPYPKNISGIDMQIPYDRNSLAFYKLIQK